MKKSFVLLVGLLLVNGSMISAKATVSDTLRITGTPDIYPLASVWAEEYSAASTGLIVKVIMASDNSEAEDLMKSEMIGFVTARNYPGIRTASGWSTLVGRDVIVPVINSRNPAIEKLNQQGMTAGMLLKIMNSTDGEKWGSLIPGSENAPINYYWINEESVAASISGFTGAAEINRAGREVAGSEALISAISRDIYGIGFCRLTSVVDMNDQSIADGISLLPIDKNSNGTLDYSENIYGDYNQLSRGIWIGKYPKSLYSNIYAAGITQPSGEATLEFLRWVLGDGQKFLLDNGYNDLLLTERQQGVDKLYETKVYVTSVSETRSPIVVLLLMFAAALIIVVAADRIIQYVRRTKSLSYTEIPLSEKVFAEAAVLVPQGLYYDKTHTWAFMEQDGLVKVGIDDFLQHITGTITRVKMKKDGSKVKKGEQILSIIQNGKNLDLYAPVSGIIREHNTALETNSGLINTSPYNEGWIFRIEPSNWQRENQLLFFSEKYRQFLIKEFTRFKDFLTDIINTGNEKYSYAILQDGGELYDGILSQMGPEVWEDFQTKYIDPSRQIWFTDII